MLPNDPFILLSVLNTKLRDEYSSLTALCDDMDVDIDALKEKMESVGFTYNPETNSFK